MLAAQDHKKSFSVSAISRHTKAAAYAQKGNKLRQPRQLKGCPIKCSALISRYIHPYPPAVKHRVLPLPFHCPEAIYNTMESSTFLLFELTLVASVDMNCKSHPVQILRHELAYKQD